MLWTSIQIDHYKEAFQKFYYWLSQQKGFFKISKVIKLSNNKT